MNTSKTTRTLEVAATATAAVGAALVGGGAAHADAPVGQVSEARVTCYGNPHYPEHNEVIVQPPAMTSSGAHPQRVAYRAVLYRWTGTRLVRDRVGPTVRGSASDTLRAVRWDDAAGASTWFSTPGSGYYTVHLRYTWFGDSRSVGGTTDAWAAVYEHGRASYCLF